jgi:hypothetical protein
VHYCSITLVVNNLIILANLIFQYSWENRMYNVETHLQRGICSRLKKVGNKSHHEKKVKKHVVQQQQGGNSEQLTCDFLGSRNVTIRKDDNLSLRSHVRCVDSNNFGVCIRCARMVHEACHATNHRRINDAVQV